MRCQDTLDSLKSTRPIVSGNRKSKIVGYEISRYFRLFEIYETYSFKNRKKKKKIII